MTEKKQRENYTALSTDVENKIEKLKAAGVELKRSEEEMIKTIKEWEDNHPLDDKSWNYYEIWVSVLEKLIYEKDVLNRSEVSSFFNKIIDCKSQILNE